MKTYVTVKRSGNRWVVILVTTEDGYVVEAESLGWSDNEDDAYAFAIDWEATL